MREYAKARMSAAYSLQASAKRCILPKNMIPQIAPVLQRGCVSRCDGGELMHSHLSVAQEHVCCGRAGYRLDQCVDSTFNRVVHCRGPRGQLAALSIDAAANAQASVRAHGHARVDPRWIALPRPLQTLYGHNEEPAPSTDAAGAAVRQRPRYKDVDDANTVCIYSTDSVTIPLQLEPQADSTPDAAAADSEAAAKPETAVGASPPNVQTFTFSFRAPQDLPPTYRGVVVKYFYMATVSIVIARHTAASAGWGVR
eukprot:5234-Heterococcus_DN1.PRE.2